MSMFSPTILTLLDRDREEMEDSLEQSVCDLAEIASQSKFSLAVARFKQLLVCRGIEGGSLTDCFHLTFKHIRLLGVRLGHYYILRQTGRGCRAGFQVCP